MTGTVPTNFTFADGQHELNLWIPQELSSAVIEFDASVPAGTSFSVSAANTTTESYVFTETDMMNGLGAEGVLGAETMGNTVYFGHWGDGSTSFELGASLAAVYSQISTPGTVLVQNGNEYVVQSAQNQ